MINKQQSLPFTKLIPSLIICALALLNIASLIYSMQLYQQYDDRMQLMKDDASRRYGKQNIPFIVLLILSVLLQFAGSDIYPIFNPGSILSFFMTLLGALAALAIGASQAILAEQLNFAVRTLLLKDQLNYLSKAEPCYFAFRINATLTLLISLPILCFILYNKLKILLSQSKDTSESPLVPQIASIGLFAVNIIGQLVLIINSYQNANNQQKVYYKQLNKVDVYASFIQIGILLSLAYVLIYFKFRRALIMSKKLFMIITIIPLFFMFGSFMIIIVLAIHAAIQINIYAVGCSPNVDCDSAKTYCMWMFIWTGLNMLAIIGHFIYLKTLAQSPEREWQSEPLLDRQ